MSLSQSELGDIATIEIGKTPSRANPVYWDDGHSWLTISDYKHGSHISGTKQTITDRAIKECGVKIQPVGTLVMSFKLTIGKLGFLDSPMATNEAIAALKPNDLDELDPRFLYHYLRQFNFDSLLDRAAKGKTLNKAKLKRIPISYPTEVKEQRRIAAILDKADAIRRKREQALTLADDLLRSTFLDMFGDPVLNTKQLPTILLGDLIKVSSGDGLTAKNMDPAGKYPVYGGNGVNGFHSEFMFEDPQIVIGRVGVYCGAVHVTQPNSWVTDNALYVREYKKPIELRYLEWALRFANLNQYAGRAAQPLISGNRIYPIEIVFPSESEQQNFRGYVERHRAATNQLSAAVNGASDLFASLSQRAFRGEL